MEEALGGLTMAWAGLEHAMALVLGELLETDTYTALVASAALDYRHRRNLISSLAQLKLLHPQTRDKITSTLGNIKGLAKERNEAVHSLHAANNVRIVIRNQGLYQQEMKRVSPRYIASVSKKVTAQANELTAMCGDVRVAVATWRKICPPPEPPHLPNAVRHLVAIDDIFANQLPPFDPSLRSGEQD